MKIIVTARTRNSANEIERFCQSYQWADYIFLADGGSEDDTINIAHEQMRTFIIPFYDRIEMNNGLWRNPHGSHINFLIEWAKGEDADWIIFDDVDCVPNKLLQNEGRGILENTEKRAVMAFRMYIKGKDQWFPKMNEPGQSLWAWRPFLQEIWASESDPAAHDIKGIPDDALKLDFPLALLHYFYPDEETMDKKLDFYRKSGQHPNIQHPMDSFGKLDKLPEWAEWK